jgi:hypothetical protein
MKFIMSILIFVIVSTAWAQDVPTLSVNVNVVSLLGACPRNADQCPIKMHHN